MPSQVNELAILVGRSRVRMSTSSNSATRVKVYRSGWLVLVHHFDTVAGSLSSCSASHLLVRSVSANTALIRFIRSILISIYLILNAKIIEIIGNACTNLPFSPSKAKLLPQNSRHLAKIPYLCIVIEAVCGQVVRKRSVAIFYRCCI